MRKLIYISIIATISTLLSCTKVEEDLIKTDDSTIVTNVEILEDGRMAITGQLGTSTFGDASISSRAAISDESQSNISEAWCLIFGEDAKNRVDGNTTSVYTDESPLLLCNKITTTATGTFHVTFPQYHGVCFMRIVANLTEREKASLEATKAWGDDDANYYMEANTNYLDGIKTLLIPGYSYDSDKLTEGTISDEDMAKYGKFGQYRNQSVGLDGIYSNAECADTSVDDSDYSITYSNLNENAPNPSSSSNYFTGAIPMSSVGFVMNDGITEESIKKFFGTTVYMVRACSKATITVSDSNFTLNKVYMIGCAQESRIRSSVLSSQGEGNTTETTLSIPENLGGTIDYEPLIEEVTSGNTTSPIFFYPNSGGDYDSNNGAVDQDVNPQYIIIKGKSSSYDTDGYYKIALRARYALSYVYNLDDYTLETDEDGNYIVDEWSDVTYDILRNTHFKVELLNVDKPGYKTLADAKDPNSPASNISYSITILGDDGRNEILVSNGTYYVELNTTRIYMAGYGKDGNAGSVKFSITPNDANVDGDYFHPAVYVQADYGVNIESCIVDGGSLLKIDLSDDDILKGMFDSSSVYYDQAVASAYLDWEEFKSSFYDTSDATDEIHDQWFKVPSSSSTTDVDVNFRATSSGRIRLRIGDMLKFIPVNYDSSELSIDEQQLAFSGYSGSFAYEKIILIETDEDAENSAYDTFSGGYLTNYDWFTSSGKITNNSGTTKGRELRAMIYPINADGITKLYVKQSAKLLGDDRDEDDGTLSAGNVVYLDQDGVNEESYKNAAEAADAVIEMLDKGYTTIYFEGKTLDVADILNAVQDDKDYDGTPFSVDLSEVTDRDYYGDDFEADLRGLDCISSITLPGKISKIEEDTFNNCKNLEVIIIGSVDNPSSDFDEVTEGACDGCTSLKTIIVYSQESSVIVERQKNTVNFTSNSGVEIKSGDRRKTIIGTGAKGYMFFFGDTTGYTYGGEYDFYVELYTTTES